MPVMQRACIAKGALGGGRGMRGALRHAADMTADGAAVVVAEAKGPWLHRVVERTSLMAECRSI